MKTRETEVRVDISCSSCGSYDDKIDGRLAKAVAKIEQGFKELDRIPDFPHRHIVINGTYCDISLSENRLIGRLQRAFKLVREGR